MTSQQYNKPCSVEILRKQIQVQRNALILLSDTIDLLEQLEHDPSTFKSLQKSIEDITTSYIQKITVLVSKINEIHN